ncbi:MAG: alpha/beta hydrolase [Lachnospiraceae bacterium]
MSKKEKISQNMLQLIKKVHSTVENNDVEKQRHVQANIGNMLSNKKEIKITQIEIENINAEWVCVDRTHMQNYVILYCHGGGYSTGSSNYARTITTKLAMYTSMDVLCFNYRLAPEHPYPAALEDGMEVWDYLMHIGYGAKNIIVAGDSAGGNLALCLTHQLKKQKRLLPRALVLMSPWTDLLLKGKSHSSRESIDPILNKEYLVQMIENYAQNQELLNPFISPIYGNFNGFPPTYIQVGDHEILLSDSTMLHKQMVKANTFVKLDIFEGMWHVFQMSPFKDANEAIVKIAEFIYEVCK